MAKPEIDYEIVSLDSELGDGPELRKELVVLETWLRKNGKVTAFWEAELTTGEHDDLDLSSQVFDKAGNIVRIKRGGYTYEYLSRTTRDGDNQRVWASAEECEKRLKPLGKYITNKMVAAANKANYGDAINADDAESDAEGKSEGQ
jgi:hypothetical protein